MAVVSLRTFVTARLRRCREQMRDRALDALIVVNPVDVRYLTGFTGDDSILVITAKRRVLVSDTRFTIQIQEECPGLSRHIRKNAPMSVALKETLTKLFSKWRKRKPPLVGIETESLPIKQYKVFKKAIGKGFREAEGILSSLRLCKDAYEIKQTRLAAKCAQDAMKAVLRQLKIGMSEIEIAGLLDYEMAQRGGRPPAFPVIVAYGGHAAQPHAAPGKARLKDNQTFLFDWGATVNGYKSDLTRCYGTGKIPPVFIEAYKWVLEAQLSAIKAVKSGVRLAEVDEAARKVMRRSKLPVYGHGTGHGLGLDIHEEPRLSQAGTGELAEGMIVTVEPGVYLPERFGIRIEDDVLVTATGATCLTRFPKDLASLANWGR
jgi:Xaa-Pro aminopeptidase